MAIFDPDPIVDTLFLPFLQDQLHWPVGSVAFLRARPCAALRNFQLDAFLAEQSFKPLAEQLQKAGAKVVETLPENVCPALVLVLPPRQRDEARALFARAVKQAGAGARVVACVANDEGAKSAQVDLHALAGVAGYRSKNHCRVFWTGPLEGSHDAALLTQWLALDAPRPILDGRYTSRPGVFAWDRVDAASALLAEHLPTDLSGSGADLGAGWGFLSTQVLARNPAVSALHLYEAENRALECARLNLAGVSAATDVQFHWHDVAGGLPQTYDFIVMNPPFHGLGKVGQPDIGQRFIAVAAAALKPGGRLLMVANRHLPYEQVLEANFVTVKEVAARAGYKVVMAVKA